MRCRSENNLVGVAFLNYFAAKGRVVCDLRSFEQNLREVSSVKSRVGIGFFAYYMD
jgi:hypothetical protein